MTSSRYTNQLQDAICKQRAAQSITSKPKMEMSKVIRIETEHLDMPKMYPIPRTLRFNTSYVRLRSSCGELLVTIRGTMKKKVLLAYHDIGLNSDVNFGDFFDYGDMRILLNEFLVLQINAPGQERGAPTLDAGVVYPTMDELARQVENVVTFFEIDALLGIGVGAGANILARYAIANPAIMEALVLINCSSTAPSWVEWGHQKLIGHILRNGGMRGIQHSHLMSYHVGTHAERYNDKYATQLWQINPYNLSLYMDAYASRTALDLRAGAAFLRVPVLNITGAYSLHVQDTIVLNKKLNPATSTWLKISDCGNVLEEQPEKVAEAFYLFLRGESYFAPLSPAKISEYRQQSLEEPPQHRACRQQTSAIRIIENPISEAVAC